MEQRALRWMLALILVILILALYIPSMLLFQSFTLAYNWPLQHSIRLAMRTTSLWNPFVNPFQVGLSFGFIPCLLLSPKEQPLDCAAFLRSLINALRSSCGGYCCGRPHGIGSALISWIFINLGAWCYPHYAVVGVYLRRQWTVDRSGWRGLWSNSHSPHWQWWYPLQWVGTVLMLISILCKCDGGGHVTILPQL